MIRSACRMRGASRGDHAGEAVPALAQGSFLSECVLWEMFQSCSRGLCKDLRDATRGGAAYTGIPGLL